MRDPHVRFNERGEAIHGLPLLYSQEHSCTQQRIRRAAVCAHREGHSARLPTWPRVNVIYIEYNLYRVDFQNRMGTRLYAAMRPFRISGQNVQRSAGHVHCFSEVCTCAKLTSCHHSFIWIMQQQRHHSRK